VFVAEPDGGKVVFLRRRRKRSIHNQANQSMACF